MKLIDGLENVSRRKFTVIPCGKLYNLLLTALSKRYTCKRSALYFALITCSSGSFLSVQFWYAAFSWSLSPCGPSAGMPVE